MLFELEQRGLIHQITNVKKLHRLLEKKQSVYAGFDPTAPSLHIGNLVSLLLLKRFQKAGHRPIVLIGGATGMIGDPSGKNNERNLLDEKTINKNVQQLAKQFRKHLNNQNLTLHSLLNFDGSDPAVLVDNNWWMQPMSFLQFLREVGKHFPVSVMLNKDSVKRRITESGLSYTEFSYMLIQAYDFVRLYDEYDCRIQIGGSDQWGNITAGIDLARRMRNVELFGLTTPLLTKKDGTKMGKTESGTIWLDPSKTSPYEFYQYWLNVEDDDVDTCLKMLTELPLKDIAQLDENKIKNPEQRESQKVLAEELTKLVHGKEQLILVQKASELFFGSRVNNFTDKELLTILPKVPSCKISLENTTIVDALVESGLAKTRSEGTRLINQGGIYVNNSRINENRTLNHADLTSKTIIVLRTGKKKYGLLRIIPNEQ